MPKKDWKRATRTPSDVFREVLQSADRQLAQSANDAAAFEHRGIRGTERANALRTFLDQHLPSVFQTAKGEAIDFQDNRTGEIDFCIYDALTATPIQASSENALIPAEALYAVIEVKSALTQDELIKCFVHAMKVRSLKPFKKNFVAARKDGEASGGDRCLYMVFAYTTNVGKDDWARKEFERVKVAASAAGTSLDLIDRIVVFDRGIISPGIAMATLRDEGRGMFLDFFIHVVNFLTRERKRRKPIDWTVYTSRSEWKKIT